MWVGGTVYVAGAQTWRARRLERVESGVLRRQVHIGFRYVVLEPAGSLGLSSGPVIWAILLDELLTFSVPQWSHVWREDAAALPISHICEKLHM